MKTIKEATAEWVDLQASVLTSMWKHGLDYTPPSQWRKEIGIFEMLTGEFITGDWKYHTPKGKIKFYAYKLREYRVLGASEVSSYCVDRLMEARNGR